MVRTKLNGCVQTLLEAFLNMSLRYACFNNETFFPDKIRTSSLGNTYLQCQIFRIFKLLDVGLKEFCCICLR